MQSKDLEITVHRRPGTARVEVRGELDLMTLPELEEQLDLLHGQHVPELVVDLRHVTFIGSTALHACLKLDADARRDGHAVRFVRPAGQGAWLPFVYVGLADQLAFVGAEQLDV